MSRTIYSSLLFHVLLLSSVCTHAQTITTFAGTTVTAYSGDGAPATAANMSQPLGVVTDAAGNVYIADAGNNRIRRISAGGIITTFAGNGIAAFAGDGGPATAASLNSPHGLVLDAAGNMYIADRNSNRIRKVSTTGIISTVAGTGASGYSGDGGPATSAILKGPTGVAVDMSNNIYIADQGNNRIRKVNAAGIISKVAGNGGSAFGGDGGAATAAALNAPTGVAVDAAGNIYIADQLNSRIRKVNASGVISSIAGNGMFSFGGDGGAATLATLYQPTGVKVDAAGNVFIADLSNNRIRKVATSGIVSTVTGVGGAGYAGDGGPATAATINRAFGLALDAAGNIYIADGNNNRVRKVNTAGVIATIGGTGMVAYGDGGPATAAVFDGPYDVACDDAGNVYVADLYHNMVRKISVTGTITTVAGNGTGAYSGDGGPATSASIYWPEGITVDRYNNLYIADGLNNRIRKVDTSGIITTVVGNGIRSHSGDGGPATTASISGARDITVDTFGNLYVTEASPYIRKVNTSGIITTVAGNGTYGYSGDGGPATAAGIWSPAGLAMDAAGNLFFADMDNHRLRKVDASGIITTVVGDGTLGFAGDGGPASAAKISNPDRVLIDALGNLFFSDWGTYRVRRIDTAGIITTVAGNGVGGYAGDGGPATDAKISTSGICMDNLGNLYLADWQFDIVRKIGGFPAPPPPPNLSVFGIANESHGIKIHPNPASRKITILSDDTISMVEVRNLLGQSVFRQAFNADQVEIDISLLPTGVYFIRVNNESIQKVLKE